MECYIMYSVWFFGFYNIKNRPYNESLKKLKIQIIILFSRENIV